MAYKNKNKEKKSSKTWYERHKGKPVEHPEKICVICGDKYIQKHSRQITCGKESCIIERRRINGRNDWHKRIKHHSIRKRKSYDKDSTKQREGSKKHYEENKELRAKQSLERYHVRYKTDEGYRMRRLLGVALGYVIRHYIKTGKIANPMKKYYINWKGIVKQLSPFPKNRSKYHVDHIIPLFKFDLTDFQQIHIAFAPENHRWMLAKDNLKRSKLKRERFPVQSQR